MPVTRSASRAAVAAVANLNIGDEPAPTLADPPAKAKRKAAPGGRSNGRKKARADDDDVPAVPASVVAKRPLLPPSTPPVLVPAVLTFSFEEAKQHLIEADPRFEDIFNRMKCRPFEHLEQIDPFRYVYMSISCCYLSHMKTIAPWHTPSCESFVTAYDRCQLSLS